MALIKSTILAQVSGSLNGTVFSHNSGGAYIRNRSIPANPGTDRQDQVRTALTSISKSWATSLSEAQREQWRLYGASVTVINRIGDPISLSGIAAFQRVNLFRMATLGEEMTLTAPAVVSPPATPIPSFNSFSFTNATAPTAEAILTSDATGFGLIAYFSGPLSPGIRYYRGPYASFASMENDLIETEKFTLAMTSEYLALQSVATKLILFDNATSLKIWEVYVDPSVIPSS